MTEDEAIRVIQEEKNSAIKEIRAQRRWLLGGVIAFVVISALIVAVPAFTLLRFWEKPSDLNWLFVAIALVPSCVIGVVGLLVLAIQFRRDD